MSVKVLDFEITSNPLEQIEEIYEFRKSIKDPKVHTLFVNKVREAVQKEAVKAIENGPRNCMVIMATGAGKSKVAIDYSKSMKGRHCLLVPTQKLRDANWKEEYQKWNAYGTEKRTEKYCYVSANKVQNKIYNLAILDEGHNITEANSEFFYNNQVKKAVLLTATRPSRRKDFDKFNILQELGFKVVFELTLDQAVKLGFVAPYEVNIINVPLESSKKTIKGGTKAKPFMTTEKATYDWIDKSCNKAIFSRSRQLKFLLLKRMRFIYDLPSKQEAAQYLLDNVIPKTEKGLIFCSSIKQAEELNPFFFHSKSSDEHYNLFKQDEIKRLSCVKSLNEGHNFDGVDFALIVQLTSKEKDLIQRIGRIVRQRAGHKAKIFIIVSTHTQDEKWLEKAIENLDEASVNYYDFRNIKNYSFYGD